MDRIREHMRSYLAQLPDYTCRVTLERSTRRNTRAPFELTDRLRMEVAYTGGEELYSWPGDDRFEAGIQDLLPGHGMVSNGSYALHMRNLFIRNVATFGAPREEHCEGGSCVRLDFDIPAVRSGYAISAGNGSAPARLTGSAWFRGDTLDIVRLEVRVEHIPRSLRVAGTRETTIYAHARISDVESVLPVSSELVLRDRDGREAKNHATFDHYRRYSSHATVFYDSGAASSNTPGQPATAAPKPASPLHIRELAATLDTAIGPDAAIGDQAALTMQDGAHVTARITEMRCLRNRRLETWMVDLSLQGMVRANLELPLPQGVTLIFRPTSQ